MHILLGIHYRRVFSVFNAAQIIIIKLYYNDMIIFVSDLKYNLSRQ